jgi:hypothetical protein
MTTDKRITDLPYLDNFSLAQDWFEYVNVADTTDSPEGTSGKHRFGDFMAATLFVTNPNVSPPGLSIGANVYSDAGVISISSRGNYTAAINIGDGVSDLVTHHNRGTGVRVDAVPTTLADVIAILQACGLAAT